jgi:hypothetical protein
MADLSIIESPDGTFTVTDANGEIFYDALTRDGAEAYIASVDLGLDSTAAAERANSMSGESGDTSPSEQEVIDARDADPFEAARLDAIAAEEEASSPTEQAVIDSDPLGYYADRAKNLASEGLDSLKSLFGQTKKAISQATVAAKPGVNYTDAPDWRFRITLAPNANYLYKAPNPGILAPLKNKGVIFPYTPSVSVTYAAKYDTQSPTHSNFNIHTYQGSSVESISVTGDFTAQDVTEANYMLAVIHFLKSSTKMFYGQDTKPVAGTPPPLLYLSGFGEYQFDNHPVVLSSFTYTLPTDVDYINAYPNGSTVAVNGAMLSPFQKTAAVGRLSASGLLSAGLNRLLGSGISALTGGPPAAAQAPSTSSGGITRVPTKISIALQFHPIITRRAVSNNFSLEKYATGELLRGSKNPNNGGGIW